VAPGPDKNPLRPHGDGERAMPDAWRAVDRRADSRGQGRIRKANTTHGLRTKESRQVAAMIRALKAEARRLVELS
jgi:hypothetical protein